MVLKSGPYPSLWPAGSLRDCMCGDDVIMIILHCTTSTGRRRAGRLDTATRVSCVSVHLVLPGVTPHCMWPRQPPEPVHTFIMGETVLLNMREFNFKGSPL